MDSNKKAKTARVLGYICLVVGTVNLALVVLDPTEAELPLLVTGLSAFTIGIFMVALGRKKPPPVD
jgi:hypothetical protein